MVNRVTDGRGVMFWLLKVEMSIRNYEIENLDAFWELK